MLEEQNPKSHTGQGGGSGCFSWGEEVGPCSLQWEEAELDPPSAAINFVQVINADD